MPGRHHNFRHRIFRVFALRLTVAALLLNTLVPAGFMLHPTEGAGLTMVLCPDQSPLPGYADHKHSQSAEATGLLALGEAGDENTCAFSLVTGPVLGVATFSIQLSQPVATEIPVLPFVATRHRIRGAISVRGPPLNS